MLTFVLLLRTLFAVGPCDTSGEIKSCQCLPIVSGSEVTRCKWDPAEAAADKCKPVTTPLSTKEKMWAIENMEGSTGVCGGVTDLIYKGLKFKTDSTWSASEQTGIEMDDLVDDWSKEPTEHVMWWVSFSQYHEFILERNPAQAQKNTLIQGFIGQYNVQWWAGALLKPEAQKPHRKDWAFWGAEQPPRVEKEAMTAAHKKYLQPDQPAMTELAQNMKAFITVPYTWHNKEVLPGGILTEEQDLKVRELFTSVPRNQFPNAEAQLTAIRAKLKESFPDVADADLDRFFAKLKPATPAQRDEQVDLIQKAWAKLPFDPANKCPITNNAYKQNKVHPPRAVKISKWTFSGTPPQNVALWGLTSMMDFIAANGGFTRKWRELPQCMTLYNGKEFAFSFNSLVTDPKSGFLEMLQAAKKKRKAKTFNEEDHMYKGDLTGVKFGKIREDKKSSSPGQVAATLPESPASFVPQATAFALGVFVTCAASWISNRRKSHLHYDPLLGEQQNEI